MKKDGSFQPEDRATYFGICDRRRGQPCTVIATGIHGGLIAVGFDDGWGFLVQPHSLAVPEQARRAA